MLVVETVGRIRREHFVHRKPIKEIARGLGISRNTVRKVLRSGETAFAYARDVQPQPKLGRWKTDLDRMLAENTAKPPRERLTLIRLFEDLHGLGYVGGYDAVRRYARSWQREHSSQTAAAFVPLSFAPGEAYQFDWSHEIIVLNGVTVTVKVAHLRLCHSRMMFVRAYPRETQEMVFDAHERGFAFFKGACTRGIYDNMKTAVDAIFVGKDRQYNRRFLQMCAHHLVDPVACTPASGSGLGRRADQGSGREPGRPCSGAILHAAAAVQELRRAECVARRQMRRLRPRASASRARGPDSVGGVRGGAAEAGRLSRPVRWLPRGPGLCLEDLPGAVRQQQIFGQRERGGPPGRDLCLSGFARSPGGMSAKRTRPTAW
jgi:transposase